MLLSLLRAHHLFEGGRLVAGEHSGILLMDGLGCFCTEESLILFAQNILYRQADKGSGRGIGQLVASLQILDKDRIGGTGNYRIQQLALHVLAGQGMAQQPAEQADGDAVDHQHGPL